MTSALRERLADIDRAQSADERALALKELSEEFVATAEQIAHDHTANPDEIEDLRDARKSLNRRLGHISLSELVVDMDAAVASNNEQLLDDTLDELHSRFPQDVENPGLARANIRSIRDYEKAIELAKKNNTLVSEEIATAAVINDAEYGTAFDDVIMQSNWTVKEQDGKLTDERDIRDLEKLRRHASERLEQLRREEERKKLDTNVADDTRPLSPEEMQALLFDDDEIEIDLRKAS